MLPAKDDNELITAVEKSSSLAARGFGNAEVYLERLVERPRHVEFQVLGDLHGSAQHLFERDCSVQRRHQKIIEEAPGPNIPRAHAAAMAGRIAGIMQSMGYDNIGTVEMLMDAEGEFSFLEMNTRLQVEHGVTEEVTGVDLVKAMMRCAAGERLDQVLPKEIKLTGYAIQARVPGRNFFPSPGKLNVFRPPVDPSIRIETGYCEGRDVTPFYDPLLAKVIVKAPSREQVINRLIEALQAFAIQGVKNNIPAVVTILKSDAFASGAVHTGIVTEVLAQLKAKG
jgi:acetyl-CoA carboxylase biotin carboxylase subunit